MSSDLNIMGQFLLRTCGDRGGVEEEQGGLEQNGLEDICVCNAIQELTPGYSKPRTQREPGVMTQGRMSCLDGKQVCGKGWGGGEDPYAL